MRSVKLFLATISGILFITLNGCSKKATPTPSATDEAPIKLAYNINNHSANYPTTGIASDAAGNIYIADGANSSIRMITPIGVVTNIAGSGRDGHADGPGASASFDLPQSIAIDAAKNIYVADAANNLVRKISAAGVVTTIAGSGAVGSADGLGTVASFNFPQGIAVDNAGNIYVADTGNDLIRKIDLSGMVSTLAGRLAAGSKNGIGTNALFNIPQGLAVDINNNLFVADAGNNLIRKITPGGVVSTFVGSGFADSAEGTGTKASLNFPDGLAFDKAGNLYATEAFGNQVSIITTEGKVSKIEVNEVPAYADGHGNYTGLPNRGVGMLVGYLDIKLPNGITVDNSNRVYVTDYGNNLIRVSFR